jgi:hypothetical protein
MINPSSFFDEHHIPVSNWALKLWFNGIQVIVDESLPVEAIRLIHINEIHIGTAVNMQDLGYRLNLKPSDLRFLKSLRILQD